MQVAEEQISPILKSLENTLVHQWKTFSHSLDYPNFFSYFLKYCFLFSLFPRGMKSRALNKYLGEKR